MRLTEACLNGARHLWSESYDCGLEDVFAIQDDMAQCIADALKVTLSPKEHRSIQSVAAGDVEAHDFYVRGRSCMHTITRRDYESAVRMYQKAIERGWGDRPWLETDSDLDSLRKDPRFAALLQKIH